MVDFNPFHIALESKTGRYTIYFNAIELLHVFWLVVVDCQFHGWHAVTKDQTLIEPPYWFLCNYILDHAIVNTMYLKNVLCWHSALKMFTWRHG